ncbi:MAG TPA: ParB/RepB/Spo0J family partition protein [Vicinamibacterales bacterium]|nr:ParB/RepB/Spo0J family partition protein [Vicinamibacterales bacterium]
MSKRGLPVTLKMRHDAHYVDALTTSAGNPIGRMVPIELIDPNPEQPRQMMGDLSELKASIAEKGIIEPLVVRQRGARFQIVAGERRYQAASQLGLRELPVVLRDVDDREIIEIALIENIQRKDLGAFEEAEAMEALSKRCGYTHEDLAKRLGKSRTSVTESLALTAMPPEVRKVCRLADISSKSLLLQIVRQQSTEKMLALVEQITKGGAVATREQARKAVAIKPKAGRPRAFVFQYRPPTKTFNLKLQFKKSDVDRDEVIEALEGIIKELRSSR